MRKLSACLVGVMLCVAAPAVAGDDATNNVLSVELNNPDPTQMELLLARIALAAEFNRQRMEKVVGVSYILRIRNSYEADALVKVIRGREQLELSFAEDEVTSLLFRSDHPDYALAAEAYQEVIDSVSESLTMPQTPAVQRLVGKILGPRQRGLAAVQ